MSEAETAEDASFHLPLALHLKPRFGRAAIVASSILLGGWFVPRTHDSAAVVALEGATPSAHADLASSFAMAARLRDRALGGRPSSQISVAPLEEQSFRVTFRDASVGRGLVACNETAQQIVTAKSALVDSPARGMSATDRAILKLVTDHPELGTSVPEPERPARPDDERVRLQIERANVQSDLNKLGARAAEGPPDNPFDQSLPRLDSRVLKRRLAEIDGLLSTPARRVDSPSVHQVPELKELLATTLREPAEGPPPDARLRVVNAASLVSGSSAPSRPLLFILALLAGLSVMFVPLSGRRRVSEPPRATTAQPLSFPPDAPLPTRVEGTSSVPSLEVAYGPPSSLPPGSDVAPSSAPPAADSSVLAFPVVWQVDPRSSPARYAELCSELGRRGVEDCFVVAVVGTSVDLDARAVLAAALATGLASNDQTRVLLFEADLANTSLQRIFRFDVPPNVDLASQLTARIESRPDPNWYVAKCSPSLHVLPCDRPAPDLLLSTVLEACVRELRNYYDVIIVNGPTVEERVACRAIDDIADGIILARAPREEGAEERLATFGTKSLSVVVAVD